MEIQKDDDVETSIGTLYAFSSPATEDMRGAFHIEKKITLNKLLGFLESTLF